MAGTLVANTINTDTGLFSTNNAYNGIAKAWVNFQGGNGNTAGTINASFNVSSITVNGTGDYTINFATAMGNANYACVLTCDNVNGNNYKNQTTTYTIGTTSAQRVNCYNNGSGSLVNPAYMYAVFLD